MKIACLIAALLLLAAPARAQNVPVYATGLLTPGHALVLAPTGFPGSAVVQDAGPALAGNFTELGITNNGTPLCVRDLAGQHLLCFGALANGGGLISYNPIGSGSPLGLTININGTNYSFPGTGSGNVVGPTNPFPTTGDVALWNGGTDLRDGGLAAAHVPNLTALQAACTALAGCPTADIVYPNGVWRDTYGNGNGAPPVWYILSGSACPLNSGAGDNGSQVVSGDGKCWLAQFDAGGADVRQWGVIFDNVTNNSTGLQSAWTWEAANLGTLLLPATTTPALFATGITATIGSAQTFAMVGTGSGSMLEYTGTAGTAFTLTENGAINNSLFNFRDFSLLTPHAGAANGIIATYTGSGTNEPPAVSTFDNVTLRGADGFEQTDYWGNGIQVTGGISWVNFLVNITGPGGTPGGTGILVAGVSSGLTGIVYNLRPGSTLSQLAVGLNVGTNAQGLQISGVNFTANTRGIYVPSTSLGPVQIAVSNSQFGPCGTYCFDDQTAPATAAVGLLFSNNLFYPQSGCGINVANAEELLVVGNEFDYSTVPNIGQGICVAAAGGRSGLIASNNFVGMETSITLGAGVQNFIIGANAHSADAGFTYISNSATANTNTGPDLYTAYTPSSTSCGSGTATFTSGGVFNVVGNTVTLDLKIVVNTVASCNNINVALPGNFANVPTPTAGAGTNATANVGFNAQIAVGNPAAVNLLTGVAVAGDTYVAHLSYQITNPF
jgi:hypothetical protein